MFRAWRTRVPLSNFQQLARCRCLSNAPACSKYKPVTHADDPVPLATKKVLEEESLYLLTPYNRPPIIFVRGQGSQIWDSLGRKYLDLTAGIAVNALGHADDSVAQTLESQAKKLVHCSNVFFNEHAGQLAKLIIRATHKHGGLGFAPGTSVSESGLKLFLANSGTEANEAALKFARKVGKTIDSSGRKHGFVCFNNAFHGRSLGSLSVTPQIKYQEPFEPLIPGVTCGELNDIRGLEHLINDSTCGVIVEPIQGEGGVVEASEDFLRALRKRCDEVKALLIYDEIQCGLGRTGSLWAHGKLSMDCHPDMVTMAKPLANGIPIAAVLLKDSVAQAIEVGDHGTTFGGGPLQAAVARHVVGRITAPGFLESVESVGSVLQMRLDRLQGLFPHLVASKSRGRGLLRGLPLTNNNLPSQVVKLCRERGLLLLTCGQDTLRFVPSLNIKAGEVETACDILESALSVLHGER